MVYRLNLDTINSFHKQYLLFSLLIKLYLSVQLLGCEARKLDRAFTHRTIDAKGDVVTSPLSRDMAIYARDALAKAVYDRLFTWLVTRLNTSLQPKECPKKEVIGILDIYGFEIFERNR